MKFSNQRILSRVLHKTKVAFSAKREGIEKSKLKNNNIRNTGEAV